jgi:hypothetical protein
VLSEPTAQALREGLAQLGPLPGEVGEALSELLEEARTYALPAHVPPPNLDAPLDYLALLPSDKARAKKAKTRARARPRR